MSQKVRMVIAPAMKRLETYMEEAKTIMDAEEQTEKGLEELRKLLVKIRRTATQIEVSSDEWQAYIRTMPEEGKEAEELLFAGFGRVLTHFMGWVDKAREMIMETEILLAEESDVGSTQNSVISDADNDHVHAAVDQMGNPKRNAPKSNEGKAANGMPPVNLPRAKLPEFWGEPLRWPEFWQAFERTVDSAQVDDGLKAHYLISCLRGKARRAIMGYRAIDEHYGPMKDVLLRQFGNDKAIKDALHAEIINLPMANESVGSLRAYLEEVERICRTLIAMGDMADESIIMMAIKNKFPRAIVLELLKMEKEEKTAWTVDNLRSGLESIVSLREEAQRCTQTLNPRQNQIQRGNGNGQRPNNGFRQNNVRNQMNGRVFAAQVEKGKSNRKLECFFCGDPHLAGNCEKIKYAVPRMELLSKQNRCLNCLKKGHAKVNCPNKKGCTVCGGDHHKIICPRALGNDQMRGNSAGNTGKGPATGANKEMTRRADQLSIGDKNSKVLLMNTEFDISAHFGGKSVKVNGLFDTGATMSFITDEKVRELGLKKIGQGELNVFPFMHKNPIKINSARYLVNVMKKNGGFEEIIAYRIKRSLMPSIQGADLIEGKMIGSTEVVPDLLISIAHFWQIFEKMTPMGNSFYRIDTSVGPIVCGGNEMLKGSNANIWTAIGAVEKNEAVNKFWDLEAIGVTDHPGDKDDEIALKFFEETTRRAEDGRYVVKWPFKVDRNLLPSNFSLAFKRFTGLVEKLKKTPELLKKYDETIKEDIERGSVEVGKRNQDKIEHFIPHHAVIAEEDEASL